MKPFLLHDDILDCLEERLSDYDVYRNICFHHFGVDGEIDLYAVNNDYVIVFEAKTTDRKSSRKKAVKQLRKGSRWLERTQYPLHRMFYFYAYGRGNSYGLKRFPESLVFDLR